MKKLEEIEQRKIIKYLDDLKFNSPHQVKFTSIPNSTYTNIHQAKTKNILDGLRAGLPDLFIIINQHAFFIEMKREDGGVVSDKQKKWIDAINQCEGIKAFVCNGYEEAKKIIESYLELLVQAF